MYLVDTNIFLEALLEQEKVKKTSLAHNRRYLILRLTESQKRTTI